MQNKDEINLKLDNRFDTVILLERHGESIGNAKREFLGHTNLDLSELGYIQANKTADFLKDFKIDIIYSSDLMRAHNTVLPHAKMRNMDIIDDENLREIYAGVWEGKSVDWILSEYYEDFIDQWRANFGLCRIPNGESVPELRERIYDEVLKIAKENVGKCILIGCHAAAIRAFFGKINGTDPKDMGTKSCYPSNASISIVYYDGKDLIPGEYSFDKHLA